MGCMTFFFDMIKIILYYNNMNTIISFPEFLKKFLPNINPRFIDDFFKLLKYDDIDDISFIINFNNVIKWLDILRHKAKETLFKSYRKNIDYIITKHQKKGTGGYKKDEIMLTAPAFKKFCLLSHSKNGDMVREYFISVENALNRYRNEIIKSQDKLIKKLKNNNRPKLYPNGGVLYIIRTPDSYTTYKIGRTINLKRRVQSHSSVLSSKSSVFLDKNIDILFYFKVNNIKRVEECTKVFLKQYKYKKYKEIYECDINKIKQIMYKCEQLGLSVNHNKALRINNTKNKKYFISFVANKFKKVPSKK